VEQASVVTKATTPDVEIRHHHISKQFFILHGEFNLIPRGISSMELEHQMLIGRDGSVFKFLIDLCRVERRIVIRTRWGNSQGAIIEGGRYMPSLPELRETDWGAREGGLQVRGRVSGRGCLPQGAFVKVTNGDLGALHLLKHNMRDQSQYLVPSVRVRQRGRISGSVGGPKVRREIVKTPLENSIVNLA
jgi:hypothetical protein